MSTAVAGHPTTGRADTLALWQHLYGDQTGYLAVLTGRRPTPTSTALTDPRQRFYAYPFAATTAAGWLQDEDTAGRETYMCAHLLTDRERKKGKAAPVLTLYADGDGAEVPAHLPRPTATVESSPGREHYYWRLARPIPPERAEELNRRIAYAMGADASGWDLGQLLRPIGTTNHKHGTPTRLLHLDEHAAYDPDELERILPPAPPRAPAASAGQRAAIDGDEPPVRLAGEDLETWTGARFVANTDGTPDRSRSLYRLASILARANASGRTIAQALAERDETLGWRKYTGRPDAPERYAEIAQKVLADPAEATPVTTAGANPNCARCAPIIADLRRQLAEARQLRERLFAALGGPQVEENAQPLPPNQRMVRVIADLEHFSGRDRQGAPRAPDGSTRIRLATLARRAGCSTDTASKVLADAERAGQCTIRRARDKEGKSELWYRSTAPTLTTALDTTAQQVRPPDPETGQVKKWGGKRQRCPECGSERLLVRTLCQDCGAVVDEHPLVPGPQDAARPDAPAADAAPETSTPDPDPHLAAHGGVPTTGPQDAARLSTAADPAPDLGEALSGIFERAEGGTCPPDASPPRQDAPGAAPAVERGIPAGALSLAAYDALWGAPAPPAVQPSLAGGAP